MSRVDVATRGTRAVGGREWPVRLPPVDIRETDGEVQVIVDLPGVSEEAVTVTAEAGALVVEGRSQAGEREGAEALSREFGPVVYRRTFEISDRIDAGGIKAQLKNGVLRLTLPKREEVKPRKIQVSAA